MKKKTMLFVALASMVLATSCSQDDMQMSKSQASKSESPIGPIRASMGLKTKAVETTLSNLESFTVNAFQDGQANYMSNIKYATTDYTSWVTSAGLFYWPGEGDLHFYAYAPEQPGEEGTFKLDYESQTLTGFVPNSTAATQKDFVYAQATGNNETNGESGLDLTFQHALSEISVTAKNGNPAYKVEITGVKFGNIKGKGTFTFPSTYGGNGSWTPSDESGDVKEYETTWSDAVTLGNSVSTLDASNVPFMLIPQQLQKEDKASDGAYIALKAKITLQGGVVIQNDWVYIGLDNEWELGKHYIYSLDFTSGAGQKENGTPVFSGKQIKLNVTVAPWSNSPQSIVAQ